MYDFFSNSWLLNSCIQYERIHTIRFLKFAGLKNKTFFLRWFDEICCCCLQIRFFDYLVWKNIPLYPRLMPDMCKIFSWDDLKDLFKYLFVIISVCNFVPLDFYTSVSSSYLKTIEFGSKLAIFSRFCYL